MLLTFKRSLLLLFIFGTASLVSAQSYDEWEIAFPTSQTGPAQQHFLNGVKAMHLHMFEDAEAHFRAAQALAPDFAMAYWGEALNQHRTIWNVHRYDEARAILQRLGNTFSERAAKALTTREQDYLAAIELLFGDGSQSTRELAYSNAMAALSTKYPDDSEAQAWYALSLMRITPQNMTRQQTRSLMAATSLRVLADNPRHPGANRYLIQSTDDPENTDLGLLAVHNLSMIDTDAAEALHIPSHYYIQHGMWEQVAQSNMEAFISSMAWVEENGWSLQDLNSHNYGHLLQFANYGYLQAGLLSETEKIRRRILDDFISSGKASEIAVPLGDTYARWVLDLEQWGEAQALASMAREHGLVEIGLWQAVGIAAARGDNLDLAREAVTVLSELGNTEFSQASISAQQIESLIHFAQGNSDIALDILKRATEINSERPVTNIGVPPRPLKPVMELYGEVLLETGAAAAALVQFEQGLTVYSGRSNLLLGAARAAHQVGNQQLAESYYRQLADNLHKADDGHPFLAELAKAFEN